MCILNYKYRLIVTTFQLKVNLIGYCCVAIFTICFTSCQSEDKKNSKAIAIPRDSSSLKVQHTSKTKSLQTIDTSYHISPSAIDTTHLLKQFCKKDVCLELKRVGIRQDDIPPPKLHDSVKNANKIIRQHQSKLYREFAESTPEIYTCNPTAINYIANNFIAKRRNYRSRCYYDYHLSLKENGSVVFSADLNSECGDLLIEQGSAMYANAIDTASFRKIKNFIRK
ncbi:MAG: hypothetical protein RL660_2494 [Bacteroidota bacterium]|jgi:hypothetical protein